MDGGLKVEQTGMDAENENAVQQTPAPIGGAPGRPLSIDIIIPVYNALDQVRECIKSVVAHRDDLVNVIVVNDASHPHVGEWLDAEHAGTIRCTIIHKEQNEGYLKAINQGLELSKADIVICQNSDTIIFENFFDIVRALFQSDPKIAVINPVSVWANWTRIPFPSGHTVFSLADRLWRANGLSVRDIQNASGFCFAVRGEALLRLGSFDPVYDPGYWEETDFCMKVLDAGLRVVCAPGLFVFHHGWSSFGADARNMNMEKNERIFRSRWGEQFSALEKWFKFNDPLRGLKNELACTDSAVDNVYARSAAADGLSVLYILPSLAHYGGIISVIQVVNRLVMQGVRANIAVTKAGDKSVLRYCACYFNPLFFENEAELIQNCPQVDVVVATHWTTAYSAIKLTNVGKAKRAAYFVQDYEPDFHTDDPMRARLAEATYKLISDRICKTSWLKEKLDAYGGDTEIIPIGLNTDIFADYRQPRENLVLTMARPSSARRNWPTALKAFRILAEIRPDIALGVYGSNFKPGELPPSITSYGLLESASSVARMLNRAKVLLDASTFQGFGRPGLEAIACGVAPVLTKNGGITSYAKHMHNALLINPFDVGEIVTSICRIIDDEPLYERLRTNGKGLSANYTLDREGAQTRVFLERVLRNG